MNKWMGVGRLTRDPEVRYTTNDKGEQMCMAKFTLAIDRRGKDAGADFISCVAFGKNAEFYEKYVHQGAKMAVSGRIQTGSYTNKEGMKIYTTDVVIEESEFAESKAKEQQDTKEQPAPSDGFVKVPEGIENDLPFK